MKKLLLLLAILVSFGAQAQTTLNGCMGINFGDSKSQVKTVMSSKEGFEFYRENTETNTVSYINGSFAGRKAVGAVFHFYEDKLHTITVLLQVEYEPKAMDLYYDVVSDLKSKYEITPTQNHVFRYPFQEGDGHTVTALKRGYADVSTLFGFNDNNALTVSVTESISIKIVYQHTDLAEQAINKQNQQNKNDY